MTDKERLDWLEQKVKGDRYRDILIQWDHEDGIWLARQERGRIPTPTPVELSLTREGEMITHPGIRQAIDAAIEQERHDRAHGRLPPFF